MGFDLSARDRSRLKGVHPDLVRVIERAAKESPIAFTILEGIRSLEQQKKNVAKGVSWTMRSRHLTGHAVDVAPLDDAGKVSWAWPLYHKLAPHMKAAAKAEGVSVNWGGDWKKTKDGPHWELPRDKYPPGAQAGPQTAKTKQQVSPTPQPKTAVSESVLAPNLASDPYNRDA